MYKKKSLGQHFLKTASYLKAIADAANVQKGDVVLEIGPGEGALTKELLARGAEVFVVEKDRRLIPFLNMTFEHEVAAKKLHIYEGDALETDVEKLIKEKTKRKEYKLVANIPYYITGALLKKFLSEQKDQPSTLVFLVQKEVAERIARSKKESILSLSVKAYGGVKYIKTVPRGAFSPPPDVDSAILLVDTISKKHFKNQKNEERFFELVKAGFSQKRKLLRNNLSPIFGEQTLKRMEAAGIQEKARAEDVPLEKWLALI